MAAGIAKTFLQLAVHQIRIRGIRPGTFEIIFAEVGHGFGVELDFLEERRGFGQIIRLKINANGGGELVQAIQLGGVFSFDVSFLMNAGNTGTTFGWALFDTTHYLGVDGDLGHFFLEPDAAIGNQVVVDNAAGQLSVVTEVMEPSTGVLVLVGMLALAGRRRRGSHWF